VSSYVFLLPGALSFTQRPLVMRTLLGSCVSVAVWHPQRRWGGLCHFLLPSRGRGQGEPGDGRFADEALALLERQMRHDGVALHEYVAHLAGGAWCLDTGPGGTQPDIGAGNIAAARRWCAEHGLQPGAEHLGGRVFRHVEFDTGSGVLRVREGQHRAAEPVPLETA
jgi:chemotaxis protein CheD